MVSNNLKKKVSDIDKIKRDLAKKENLLSKDVLKEMQDLMKSHPLLLGVRWYQYTPSFNDGEACVFDMHGPRIKFDETIVPTAQSDDDGFIDEYFIEDGFFEKRLDIVNMDYISDLERAVKDVRKLYGYLYSIQDRMRIMFDDGYAVTITKDGVEVEEYSHD